ncbi:MAG TPA: DUF1385 domain-containing protein [Thermomicrobiaceae bacterium]|nr:DUF1385 domain-containing protein [Thermomicrobiaceae bacterium]
MAKQDGQSVYGGQAVMEGVMMRGLNDTAVAVQAPDGRIAVYHEPLVPGSTAKRLRPLPLFRGVFLLWDTMLIGVRALIFSANVALAEESDDGDERSEEPGALEGPVLWATVAISVGFSVALFFLLPLVAVHFIDRHLSSSIVSNLVEGGIRLVLLVGYLLFLGQLKDVGRIFGYHGAEHKTINAYEAGDPLDVEHVRRHSISHPRCGTGFLLIVVLLSIVVFAFLGRPPFLWRIVSRIALVPVIAAIAYEFMKWTAAHIENRVVRILVAPSMALQHLTTRNPSDDMLETAIASLKRVFVAEGSLAPSGLFDAQTIEVDQAGRPLQPEELPVPVAVAGGEGDD